MFWVMWANASLPAPSPPCQTDQEVAANLDSLFDKSSVAVVIRIESEISLVAMADYSLIPPSLKGDAPENGRLLLRNCDVLYTNGDVFLIFGSVVNGLLQARSSVKVYSSNLDLAWSEPTMRWIEEKIENAT